MLQGSCALSWLITKVVSAKRSRACCKGHGYSETSWSLGELSLTSHQGATSCTAVYLTKYATATGALIAGQLVDGGIRTGCVGVVVMLTDAMANKNIEI